MAGYSVTFSVVDKATKELDAINRRIAAIRAPVERMSRSISRFVDVSGLRKVAQSFEWVGKAASSVLRTLVEIVPILGTITGAATLAGMANLVRSYASWSRELTATADNLGMTTQQVQQFEDAMRLAGGQTSDMDAALKGLYGNATAFIRGQASTDTIGWLNRLGINVRDSTGHLRSMNDLMPEVIDKISQIKNPADRAAAAAALLGDSGNKVVEGFRQSSKGFEGFFRDASRYTEITDEQRRQLELFSEAQGRIGTDFDHLGQQISATLAKNFTPLITHLSEFVEKHTPEILAAVDSISTRFAAWLDGIKWENVQKGLDSLIQSLTWVSNHLDDIKLAAEIVVGIFVTKWAIQAVSAIGQVVTALGTSGGPTGTGGTGMLGKLAMAANLASLAYGAYSKLNDPATFDPKNWAKGSPFWHGMPKEQQLQYPNSPESVQQGEAAGAQPPGTVQGPGAKTSFFEHPGTWLADRVLRGGAPAAPLGLPPATAGQAPQQLGQLPGDTSWGDYGTRANNPGNMNYASWQNASGRYSYMDQTEGRQHTMAVYNTMEEGVSDAYKLMARKQEEHGKTIAGALSGWSTTAGYDKTIAGMAGMDPNAPFDVTSADPEQVQRLMAAQFKMEGRRGSHSATQEQILGGIAMGRAPADTQVAQAQAPPVPSPPANRINGAVDVNITGKNLPPDSAVTAKGSGQVNVPPPRVEFQDFASV
jgi:hypothetical protein